MKNHQETVLTQSYSSKSVKTCSSPPLRITSSVTTSAVIPSSVTTSSVITSPRPSVRPPPQQVLRDSSNVFDDYAGYNDDDDDDSERLVIDLDLELTGSKLSSPPPSTALSSQGKMSTAGHEQHEATVDKGLKMKIKRKNMPGSSSNSKDSSTSANCNSLKANSAAGEHNTENNGSAAMVQNSPPQSANSANTVNVIPSPFEKLKQAILEQNQKSPKGPAAAKVLHHKKEHHMKGKGNSPLSGNSAVAMGSPSGNPSGIPLNGVVGDSDKSMNPAYGGSQKSCHGDLSSSTTADPYEFNVKVEDSRVMGFPVGKKLKLDNIKHDDLSSPTLRAPIVAMEVDANCGGTTTATTTATNGKLLDIGVMTDPELLGPCEPGTSVLLRGIIWSETDTGLLVVNVTWRNKTYVGALLDATKHEWAPPSFRSESPTDGDNRAQGARGGRGKRGRQTMNSMGGRGRNTRSTCNPHSVFAIPASPIKCEKRRAAPSDEVPPAKRTRSGCTTPGAEPIIGEEGLIECPEPNCGKKYRHINGLKYHQNHAHKDVMLRLQNGDDLIEAEEDMSVNSAKEQQNSEESGVETVVKKEKKKKNRDGKKKKGKKNPEQQAVVSLDEDTNCSINKPEDNSKSVSFKQPTVQLTPVSVGKTVTAPIATVPVASAVNMLPELKSKKSKDKSDKKASKSEQSEDGLKESKQEKKAKKKKKDKNREKHEKQHSSEKHEDTAKNKPVPMDTCQTSPSSTAAASTVDRKDSTDSQQPMNLSNKTQEASRMSPLLPLPSVPAEKVCLVPTEAALSPAYSDISDDGNEEDDKDRVDRKEDGSKPAPPPVPPQSVPAYGQPPSLTPVFSPSASHPHPHPHHSIINLTTKDKVGGESADTKDTQLKDGEHKPPTSYVLPPTQYPYAPPPGFPYNMDPAAAAAYAMHLNMSTGPGPMHEEHKRKQQQQDSKSLSPHPRASEERKTEKPAPLPTPPRGMPEMPRGSAESNVQPRDMSRNMSATELAMAAKDHDRLRASYMARDVEFQRRLESMGPEKRAQYEQDPRRFLFYEQQEAHRRERKMAPAAAASHPSPSTSSPIASSSSHDIKKEHLHSPIATNPRPDGSRTLEERLRAPEDRIRVEDRVRGSPSPHRTSTPSSSKDLGITPRSTPTTSSFGSHPFYSPHHYPGPGMYPPPTFMGYPPAYHPAAAAAVAAAAQQDGKALEMLQQHASQIQQQQHNERVREQEQRAQNSPSTNRHLLSPYAPHPAMYFPGSLSSPQAATRMGHPK